MIDQLKRLFLLEEVKRRYLKLADDNKELYEKLIPLNQDFLAFYESVKRFSTSLEESFKDLKIKQKAFNLYNLSTRQMELDLQKVGELNLQFVKELGSFIEAHLYLPTRISDFIKEIHSKKSMIEDPTSFRECENVLSGLENELHLLNKDYEIYKYKMLQLKSEFKGLQILHNKDLN